MYMMSPVSVFHVLGHNVRRESSVVHFLGLEGLVGRETRNYRFVPKKAKSKKFKPLTQIVLYSLVIWN